MNHVLVYCVVIVGMYAMVALNAVLERHHKCISCGRRFEHAKDCPVVRARD